MKKNAEGQVVCERCEKPIDAGQSISYSTTGLVLGMSSGIPACHWADPEYNHSECLSSVAPAHGIDAIKEALVNLDPKDQRKAYLFLHDGLRMRI